MRSYKNNKRHRFRVNGDRNSNRNYETQSLASNLSLSKKNHRNTNNASRLIEKYNNLAREALSNGDKILSESYFQHSDHFIRIQNEKEKNQENINSEKNKQISDKSKSLKTDSIDEKKIAAS